MNPSRLLFFVVALTFLLAFIQLGLLTIAFDKLGLSPTAAYLLLFGSLVGSAINIPLFSIRCEVPWQRPPPALLQRLYPQWIVPERTLVAFNVGGCLVPLLFSFFLMAHHQLTLFDLLLPIAGVSTISFLTSRPIEGLGIGMPLFIAPISAALFALITNPQESAPLAYIGGTLGVIIGADLLRLKDIRRLGTPFASIGGAGTFDGIFLTGLVAVLLA